MVELTVAVPQRVAQDLIDTIAWVREHLDGDFAVDAAVTQAVLAWVSDVRLEFINVGLEETHDAQRADAVAPVGFAGAQS